MNWKDLLPLNWSRKAQIVVVTIAGIGYVAGLADLDAAVAIRGMLLMAGVGALGVVCQCIIDYKHPHAKNGDQPTTTAATYIIQPGSGLTVRESPKEPDKSDSTAAHNTD